MPNNDLISRAVAIDAIVSATSFPNVDYIKNLCQSQELSEYWVSGVCDAISAVENVDAVDAVDVVHARWVKEPDRYCHWHCSNCEFVEGITSKVHRYCPNCGAKMELEGNDGKENC